MIKVGSQGNLRSQIYVAIEIRDEIRIYALAQRYAIEKYDKTLRVKSTFKP